MLGNLIGNAVRHGGEGVRVHLFAEPGPGDAVRFTVADDGVGIPQEHHEAIFRKHASLCPEGTGSSGLGLTFCRLAVEAHGGWIRVRSAAGEGAEFQFLLPGSPEHVSAAPLS
ncbi:MAG: ATP-binding protein [Gemmatimonadota bacterium]|nr:ATP-binding protein [Gemmatimonadota bacterium]